MTVKYAGSPHFTLEQGENPNELIIRYLDGAANRVPKPYVSIVHGTLVTLPLISGLNFDEKAQIYKFKIDGCVKKKCLIAMIVDRVNRFTHRQVIVERAAG